MKSRYLIAFFIVLLVPSVFVGHGLLISNNLEKEVPDFFVGIDVAYDDLDEIFELIDEVSSYTNVFVIGSSGISYNKNNLDQVCQVLYEKDMYFIIYGAIPYRLHLFKDIEERYPNHFLGVYFADEPGGYQLDLHDHRSVFEASNYTDAATQFINSTNFWLERRNFQSETGADVAASDFDLFTSDYALYWFDYKSGYDTVVAQFGWNYSRQLNIALCRGAATVQNKEWGAIITWTYNNPPYIESGEKLYNDLVLAYENGAKYILIFDSNEEYTQGILKKEHLDALKQFWHYTKDNPRSVIPVHERVAYVLPKDFAYGFRGPNDKIWGLWEADDLSFEISSDLGNKLKEYGSNLDIIYDDNIEFDFYSEYIFWNGTVFNPPV